MKGAVALLIVGLLIPLCSCAVGLLPGYYSYTWASGLTNPRQMHTFANGDVLVIQGGNNNTITLLTDRTNTSRASNAYIIASAPGIKGNLNFYDGFIYAANSSHILRWRYTPGSTAFVNTYQVVIQGLPTTGHTNHPITFDPEGRIYVSVGSWLNLDPTDYRSHIVRTDDAIDSVTLPLTWPNDLTIFATGTRNEAGLRFNRLGELWGVENGMDNLNRTDLAQNLVTNNPGEELNLFPDYRGLGNIPIGKFYGYPYCFSEYMINSTASGGRGAQWYVPGYNYSDAWCKNTSNVEPPRFLLPAHNAPLDINYYESSNPAIQGTWPDLDAMYIASHGSWNRQPPSGYRVMKLVLDRQSRAVVSSQPFFYYINESNPAAETGDGWYRPAGVSFGSCGGEDCLLIASDSTGDITAVKYRASTVVSSSSTLSASGMMMASRTAGASIGVSGSASPSVSMMMMSSETMSVSSSAVAASTGSVVESSDVVGTTTTSGASRIGSWFMF